MNPYEILGIPRTAKLSQIKRAFRKKAMATHPDRGGSPEAFKAVQQAWRILSDEAKRRQFDETGKVEPDKPDNRLAQALDVIAKTLGSVFASCRSWGDSHKNRDLVKMAEASIREVRAKAIADKFNVEQDIATIKDCAERFETSGEDNYLAAIVRMQILPGEQQLRQIEGVICAHEKALEVLKGFSYRMDKTPNPVDPAEALRVLGKNPTVSMVKMMLMG